LNLSDKKISIDLLKYKDSLTLSSKDGKTYIFDPVRKKQIILQPEEFVRQLWIQYFIQETNFHRNNIQVEKTIIINHLPRRFDIVIYNKKVQPYILVECKAPEIVLTQASFDQITMYNMEVLAPYLIITNGKFNYCVQLNHKEQKFDFLQEIPTDFSNDYK
jgi:hypothetical protein